MKNHKLMTALCLLGVGACSSQEDPVSQDAIFAKQSRALTAAPAQISVPRPTRLSVKPTVVVTAPAATPKAMSAPPAVTPSAGPPPNAAPAPAPSPGFSDPEQAAVASLDTLAELVGSDRPEKRGYASAVEAKSSTVADGVPVHMVRLDSLVAYRSGQDAKGLLFDKQEIMYPLTVGGGVRSSVTVKRRADGRWEAVQFGNAPVAQSARSTRGSVMSNRRADAGSVSLVEIPTVATFLLSHKEKDVLMVTPLYDVPGTSFKAGVTRTAAEVFSALQPIASNVNPNVPN